MMAKCLNCGKWYPGIWYEKRPEEEEERCDCGARHKQAQ